MSLHSRSGHFAVICITGGACGSLTVKTDLLPRTRQVKRHARITFMRTISSSLTFFNKYVFLGAWSGLFGVATLVLFISKPDDPAKYQFLVAWIVGTAFIYLVCGRIKEVQIDGDKLIISNFIKSDQVNLSEIVSVSGSVLLSPELVWFKLRTPSIFGTTIIFMPKLRFFGGFSKHPMVNELKRICKLSY